MGDPLKVKDELEWQIQQRIINRLKILDWFVKPTHGSAYQSGFPDLFACHKRYGHRWIEVKRPVGYKFTPAQLEWFPQMVAHGSGIWIAQTEIDIEKLIMGPCNWWVFLGAWKSS